MRKQGECSILARRAAGLAGLAMVLLAQPAPARWWIFGRRPPLERPVGRILEQPSAARGFWGIEVARPDGGKLIYSLNAAHLFQPASNMKLFTTACALEKLSPNFIFRTTVETAEPPDAQGRVGDLILVGRGDPDLGSRVLPYHLKTERKFPADAVFQNLAAQVAAKGVKEVTGNIVADDSYFLDEPYPPDWAVDDMPWGYGAPITALAFNDNELLLHLQPAATAGSFAAVSIQPLPHYYVIHNEVRTAPADVPTNVQLDRAVGSRVLDVRGQIALGSPADDQTVAIADPPRAIGRMFKRELESEGIEVLGQVVVRHANPAEAVDALAASIPTKTPPAVTLAEHDSPPLCEDVTVTLKVSQNLHAEMLLRTVAHQLTGEGSREAGVEVLRKFTSQFGVEPQEVFFADGSGLSRADLVSPAAIVKLLQFMAQSADFQPFYDALPVAAEDGTLADRFKGTPAAGRIHAKTGSIEHVASLSGYMDLPSGNRLVFSIIANAQPLKSSEIEAVIDQIALAIFNTYAHAKHIR